MVSNKLLLQISGLILVCAAMPTLAQKPAAAPAASTTDATPTTEEMIDKLKSPKTRSLRNLTVEATPRGTSDNATGFALAAQSDATLSAKPALTLLIQFDFNSAKVRAESQQALANLSQALQSTELSASKFAVEGHTDAKGNANYNQKLSEARAQAVRDYLKTQGIEADRLVVAGKGSTDLANTDAPFAAENRRVRIVNLD